MTEPKTGSYVSYCRVSTVRQGRSGLGLEAQQRAVSDFLNGGSWKLVGEFVEVESGKKADNRPQLAAALKTCRLKNATLVVAKLDRLSRDAHFLLGLQNAGVRFVAVDMPEANEMTVGIMAVVAQAERKMISQRTIAALAAAKERGKKLGGFRRRAGTAEDLRKATAVALRKRERALWIWLPLSMIFVQAALQASALLLVSLMIEASLPRAAALGRQRS